CKFNEDNVFGLPQVRQLLDRYVKVKLYTDIVPAFMYDEEVSRAEQDAEAEKNLAFQRDRFQDERLPLYVIVEPTADGFREVARYNEGKINNTAAFTKFLRDNLNEVQEK